MKTGLRESIQELVEKTVKDTGYELFSLTFFKSSGRDIVSIVLDKMPTGITLDECAAWNRKLSDLLDQNFAELEQYTIEVSSPGMDRKLKTARDYKWAVGKVVSLSFKDAQQKDQMQTIILKAADESCIDCMPYPDGELFKLRIADITHARLKPIIK